MYIETRGEPIKLWLGAFSGTRQINEAAEAALRTWWNELPTSDDDFGRPLYRVHYAPSPLLTAGWARPAMHVARVQLGYDAVEPRLRVMLQLDYLPAVAHPNRDPMRAEVVITLGSLPGLTPLEEFSAYDTVPLTPLQISRAIELLIEILGEQDSDD